MDFDLLPIEIKIQIFSYLTPRELCIFVAPVCKKWRQMAYEPILWNKIELNGRKQSTQLMMQILQRSPQVYDLKIINIQDWNWASRLKRCNFLRKLTLDLCTITYQVVSPLVRQFPSLQEISISLPTCDKSNNGIYQILKWKLKKVKICFYSGTLNGNVLFLNCPSLESLDLTFCNNIGDRGLETFVDCCRNLRTMRLYGLQKISGECLMKILRSLPNFKYLNIGQCSLVTSNDIRQLKAERPNVVVDYNGLPFRKRKRLRGS